MLAGQERLCHIKEPWRKLVGHSVILKVGNSFHINILVSIIDMLSLVSF